MKRARYLSAFLFLVAGLAVYSCKKIDKPQTRLTRLQHTWKLVQTATDANANGQIDGFEIQSVDASFDNTITFNTDYSGKETVIANGVATDYPFTWDMDAHMDTITRNGVGHNTIKYYLANISSIKMELIVGTNQGPVAYFYDIK